MEIRDDERSQGPDGAFRRAERDLVLAHRAFKQSLSIDGSIVRATYENSGHLSDALDAAERNYSSALRTLQGR
jgi:hypothetical protein